MTFWNSLLFASTFQFFVGYIPAPGTFNLFQFHSNKIILNHLLISDNNALLFNISPVNYLRTLVILNYHGAFR